MFEVNFSFFFRICSVKCLSTRIVELIGSGVLSRMLCAMIKEAAQNQKPDPDTFPSLN